MSVFVNGFDGTKTCYDIESLSNDSTKLLQSILLRKKYPCQDVQLLHNGRLVGESSKLQQDGTYYVILGLRGGKGGFGAMLRMLGAQIEKTTNREACRDLSGRRMRDVNNEKKLQSWIEKSQQQEEERKRKRREKLERMRSQPKHYFVDPSYDKQKEAVTDSLDEAVSRGIDVAGPSGSGAASSRTLKRKADSEEDDEGDDDEDDPDFKKHCMWLGVDGYDSDEEEESTTDQTSSPGDTGSSQDITEESVAESSSSPTGDSKEARENGDAVSGPALSSKSSLLSSLPPPASSKPPASEAAESGPIELEDFSSAAELEELGLDRLKSALIERGMKCGGTLQERAQRLYTVKGLQPSQIDPSLRAKPSKGKKGKKK